MFDPVAKKIIVSRDDVVFDEHNAQDWDASYELEQLMELEYGDDIE